MDIYMLVLAWEGCYAWCDLRKYTQITFKSSVTNQVRKPGLLQTSSIGKLMTINLLSIICQEGLQKAIMNFQKICWSVQVSVFAGMLVARIIQKWQTYCSHGLEMKAMACLNVMHQNTSEMFRYPGPAPLYDMLLKRFLGIDNTVISSIVSEWHWSYFNCENHQYIKLSGIESTHHQITKGTKTNSQY